MVSVRWTEWNGNAGAHLLFKAVMFFIARDTDDIDPFIFLPGVPDLFSDDVIGVAQLRPVLPDEALVDDGGGRIFGIAIALVKRPAGEKGDADGVEISRR